MSRKSSNAGWGWILGGIVIGTMAFRRYREDKPYLGVPPTIAFIGLILIAMLFLYLGLLANQRDKDQGP